MRPHVRPDADAWAPVGRLTRHRAGCTRKGRSEVPGRDTVSLVERISVIFDVEDRVHAGAVFNHPLILPGWGG